MKRIIKLLLLVSFKEGDKAFREAFERCKAKSGYRYCSQADVQTIFTY